MTHPTGVSSSFSNAVPVPSLEVIERMDQAREKAIAALQICGDKVRCQKCGDLKPMHKEPTRPSNDRIDILEQPIKRVEALYDRKKIPYIDYINNTNELKEELAELLNVEEKNQLIRKLPLYSSRITGFRYVCSACYDKLYYRRGRRY